MNIIIIIQAVKATHQGKGKVFVAKPVTHEAIGGPENLKIEHLLLSLLNAERAWSFAMQLKQVWFLTMIFLIHTYTFLNISTFTHT